MTKHHYMAIIAPPLVPAEKRRPFAGEVFVTYLSVRIKSASLGAVGRRSTSNLQHGLMIQTDSHLRGSNSQRQKASFGVTYIVHPES